MTNVPMKVMKKEYKEFQTWELDGTLGKLQERVDGWVKEYGEAAEVDFSDTDVTITTLKEETDAECERRTALEAQSRSRQYYHDKREWERLKQKFGGNE